MPSKSILANQPEPSSHTTTPPSAVCSEQWWRTAGYGQFPITDAGGNALKHTLLDNPVEMSGSKDDQSLSNAGDDEDETSKDSETTGSTSTPRGMDMFLCFLKQRLVFLSLSIIFFVLGGGGKAGLACAWKPDWGWSL